MGTYEDEEAAERIATEKQEQEDQWKELVKSVLSNTQIDPKYKGKQYEFLLPYEGEVTPEQVNALLQSNYATAYNHFVGLWKQLPEKKNKADLWEVTDLFKTLSASTNSLFRRIKSFEKNSHDKKPLEKLEILKKVNFLYDQMYDDDPTFDPDYLAEHLNTYIAMGIEWEAIECSMLKLCIKRAAIEERIKGKSDIDKYLESSLAKIPYIGVFVGIALYMFGLLIPFVIQFGIDAAIVYWAWDRLSGDKFSIWAWVGIAYVAIIVPVSIIHYGTYELRDMLKKILYPGWDRFKPTINSDLFALNGAVNHARHPHVNLRLVREQLTRLQSTAINIPAEFLTLIDRSIANGKHSW
jgi:hypothetical protein